MATLKLVLDKRRAKKDGTYPITLRIFHQQKYIAIPTQLSIQEQFWEENSCHVLKNHKQHAIYNLRLQEIIHKYSGKLLDLQRKLPEGYQYVKLCQELTKKSVEVITVKSFWEKEIKELIASHKYGNARNYRIALDVIAEAVNLQISFSDINHTFLKNLESHFLARKLKVNSISNYLRALRAIYNKAINNDVADMNSYPFKRFKINSTKTIPHVLPVDQLKEYFHLNLEPDHSLYKPWLMGKLSYLLAGINFIDLINLKSENILSGRVIYYRSKTSKIYSILLLPHAENILNQLHQDNASTLCNILNQQELNAGAQTPYIVRDKNKQFNKKLAQLSLLAGINVKIRSYTFRYTIANICKQRGYNVSLISELLGHNYGSAITAGYLENFNKEILDAMLKDVCNI